MIYSISILANMVQSFPKKGRKELKQTERFAGSCFGLASPRLSRRSDKSG